MKIFLTGLLAVSCPCALLVAQGPAPQATGPQVTINLKERHGQAVPLRQGFTHTGGGNIDVAQPTPDCVVVTMTAVAVAGAHPCQCSTASMDFVLDQTLEVSFDNPKIKRAKLTLEGRVIGLLRSHRGGGSASQGPAHASINSGLSTLLTFGLPSHCVADGENLSINDRQGPLAVTVLAGDFHLQQSYSVAATHSWNLLPCKAASSEFAPDPALDPLWISYWEPFHGASKKDFGFQVILKVAPESETQTAKRNP